MQKVSEKNRLSHPVGSGLVYVIQVRNNNTVEDSEKNLQALPRKKVKENTKASANLSAIPLRFEDRVP